MQSHHRIIPYCSSLLSPARPFSLYTSQPLGAQPAKEEVSAVDATLKYSDRLVILITSSLPGLADHSHLCPQSDPHTFIFAHVSLHLLPLTIQTSMYIRRVVLFIYPVVPYSMHDSLIRMQVRRGSRHDITSLVFDVVPHDPNRLDVVVVLDRVVVVVVVVVLLLSPSTRAKPHASTKRPPVHL